MGPIWGRQDPGGPHIVPVNLAIWAVHMTLSTEASRWGVFKVVVWMKLVMPVRNTMLHKCWTRWFNMSYFWLYHFTKIWGNLSSKPISFRPGERYSHMYLGIYSVNLLHLKINIMADKSIPWPVLQYNEFLWCWNQNTSGKQDQHDGHWCPGDSVRHGFVCVKIARSWIPKERVSNTCIICVFRFGFASQYWQNGHHFPDDISKWIFLNENLWTAIEISLKFVSKGPIDNIPALVQIMTWHQPGNKQ